MSFFNSKINKHKTSTADTTSERVTSMTDPKQDSSTFFKPALTTVQRKCHHCEEEEKVHRKESSVTETQGGHDLDSYVGSLGASGQALPQSSRSFFEPRFGQDFSNVRVHTDSVAAKSAQSINALAYTTGNNIVFNTGQFEPGSESGKKLIAHELTHVVQQGSNLVAREMIQRTPGTDAPDSFKEIITPTIDQSVTTDRAAKTTRAGDAIRRMLDTASGAALINRLWKMACDKKKSCGKINVTFTDDLSTCPEAAGCFRPASSNSFPYTVLIGNVVPATTRSKTLFSQWGQGDNKVTWHHTDPESAMANTLFHELLHIYFVNNKDHDPAMPTGHNDPEKGEIDPNFSRLMQGYNNQLDTNETQIHNNQSGGSKP